MSKNELSMVYAIQATSYLEVKKEDEVNHHQQANASRAARRDDVDDHIEDE